MEKYRLSRLAESDLKTIARCMVEALGSSQTKRYMQDILDCLGLLEDDPGLGCVCGGLLPGLRRIECNNHVSFYSSGTHGVTIARILPIHSAPAISRLAP